MIVGQEVKYKGKDTYIESINEDGTCVVANPDWVWDDEGNCVAAEVDYNVPYWITVNASELK